MNRAKNSTLHISEIDKAIAEFESKGKLVPNWREVLAKSKGHTMVEKTLWRHSWETLAICTAIYETLPKRVKRLLPHNVFVLAFIHDVGKSSYCHQIVHMRHSHCRAGEAAVFFYNKRSKQGEIAGNVVGWHHGERTPPYSNSHNEYNGDIGYNLTRLKMLDDAQKLFGSVGKLTPRNATMLTALITISDWLASEDNSFPADWTPPINASIDSIALDTNGELMKQARKVIEKSGFCNVFKPKKPLKFEKIFGKKPRKFQTALAKLLNKRGIYIVEAPPGSGKTKGVNHVVSNFLSKDLASGMAFANPTKFLSNQQADDVDAMLIATYEGFQQKDEELKKLGKRLRPAKVSHSSAIYDAPTSGRVENIDVSRFFDRSKLVLLNPFSVGTIDQLMMSILNVHHFYLRFFGLAGKIVVIDEYHSYDGYMTPIINRLCKMLYDIGCTVILVSATMPTWKINEFKFGVAPKVNQPTGMKPYPALHDVLRGKVYALPPVTEPEPRKVDISWIQKDDVASKALTLASLGANVIIYANTVQSAQDYCTNLERMINVKNIPIELFHSRFMHSDRDAIQNKWMRTVKAGSREDATIKRPQGAVYIATQVAEQGMDLDFDFVFSELCPMEALIQRLGRGRRDDANNPYRAPICSATSELFIIDCITIEGKDFFGTSACMYMEYLLHATKICLQSISHIQIPDGIPALVDMPYNITIPAGQAAIKQYLEDYNKNKLWLEHKAKGKIIDGLPTDFSFTEKDDEEQGSQTRLTIPEVECFIIKKMISCSIEKSDKGDPFPCPVYETAQGEILTVLLNHSNGKYLHMPDFHETAYGSIVHIYKYKLKEFESYFNSEAWMDTITFGSNLLLQLDGDSLLTMDGKNTGLKYTTKMGVIAPCTI